MEGSKWQMWLQSRMLQTPDLRVSGLLKKIVQETVIKIQIKACFWSILEEKSAWIKAKTRENKPIDFWGL